AGKQSIPGSAHVYSLGPNPSSTRMRLKNTMQQRSRGQVMVLFAIFLTALMGFMALGFDGANLFVQQRAVQSAADLSALAAVPSLQSSVAGQACPGSGCPGHDAAVLTARTTATNNGYTDGASSGTS